MQREAYKSIKFSILAPGYTGEYSGDYNELVYLRARYYAPGMARFLTKDTWAGNTNRSMSLNRWTYTENNPIMYTDPSGNSIDSFGCIPMVFSEGNGLKNMTSAQLISLCRGFFSPQYWAQKHAFDCNKLNNREWTKPQTVGALFEDYICERGPERVVFHPNDNLTKQLAYSILLDRIRREFYHGKTDYPEEQRFNHLQFFLAFADTYAANLINSPDLPVTHFLGSFNYTVAKKNTGGIQITIDNRSDLSSGTHFPGHFPPEGEGEFPLTLEKVIREKPELAFVPAWYVIDRYHDNEGRGVVAVLQPLSRSQTIGGMGGGIMRQVFTWTETDISCEIQNLPWPAYLPLLHIH